MGLFETIPKIPHMVVIYSVLEATVIEAEKRFGTAMR